MKFCTVEEWPKRYRCDQFRRALMAAWLVWIAAVIFVGLGVLINFVAAVQALRHHERDIRGLVWVTYVAIDAGGILFVAGLLALALSGVSKLL